LPEEASEGDQPGALPGRGTAQRAPAKFLLSNAPVVDKLWCGFAEGPMWTQIQLMREIEGWLINKSAETHFA